MTSTPTFAAFPGFQQPQSLERKRSSSVTKQPTIENPLLLRSPPLPTTSSFQFGGGEQRSPLATLTHTNGTPSSSAFGQSTDGLRQRKTSLRGAGGPTPPPKASLSGMMGRLPSAVESSSSSSSSQTTTLSKKQPSIRALDPPKEADSWVVVNGYVSEQDFQVISKLFHSFGRVLDMKGAACRPGVVNWVAFKYASPLQAKKALCHSPICVAQPRVLCSVHPLTPELQEALDWNNNSSDKYNNSSSQQQQTLFLTQEPSSSSQEDNINTNTSSSLSNNNTSALQEKDILMGYEQVYSDHRHRDANNICEQLLSWWFGW